MITAPRQTKHITQCIIPRYYDGKNNPAGCIKDLELVGTQFTRNGPLPAIVKTEDFGSNIAMWSAGEYQRPDFLPAILRPQLKNILIKGFDETNTNYVAGGIVNNNPGKWNPIDKFPDIYNGYLIQASGPILENVGAFYIPGTAFFIGRTGSTNTGAFGPYDVEKAILDKCYVNRSYRGFDIRVVDTVVSNIQGYALRDYGIKFSSGSAHINGQIHFWGVSPGPCVWFPSTAGGCWGGPFYVEHSPVGMLIESSGNILGPIYSKECSETNIKIFRERNTLGPIDIDTNLLGVSIYGQMNKLLGGSITLTQPNATAIKVQSGGNSGNNLIIRDIRILGINAQGIGFTSDDTINNSTIEIHCQNLNIGVDLTKIGVANTVNITSSFVNQPVILPKNWHNSNFIRVNGFVQQPR